jgi:membrane-bound lytic murein transglycosylase D
MAFAQTSSSPNPRESTANAGQEANVTTLISEAENHFRLGEKAYQQQSFDEARSEFDLAVDTILKGGLDVRSNPRLRAYFLGLIDKINALETQAVGKGEGTSEQRYEPSLLDELSNIQLDQADINAAQDESIKPDLDFAFTLTPEVRQFIHYFTQNKKGRATMATGLQRAGRYRPLARQIFREERVPLDLVWLAQAESNWRPNARSWANAQGIWQFVSWRGRQYGLRQNEWIDERSGIEQATRAAARYLRVLYDRFLDWQLAMAAYNCGEGRVDRAIAACGYADFWYLYNHRLLSQETRNYIPIILAIIIIAKDPVKYGFGDITADPPLQYDTVSVNEALDLRLIAEITNTPYEIIEQLNPELKRGITPADMEYNLRLPPGTDKQFITLLARIPKDRRDSWRVVRVDEGETLASLAAQHGLGVEQLASVNALTADSVLQTGTPLVLPLEVARTPLRGRVEDVGVQIARRSSRRMMITVRSGDTLTRIAARYGVSARDLARLNKLSAKSRLRSGQRLLLNLPNAGVARPAVVDRSSTYEVRPGDSLSSIARKYGISQADLRRWNGLSSKRISVGQRLVLTPPSGAKSSIKRTSNEKVTYRVRRGDTLSSIARHFDVSIESLKASNHLSSGKIIVGQVLTISQ